MTSLRKKKVVGRRAGQDAQRAVVAGKKNDDGQKKQNESSKKNPTRFKKNFAKALKKKNSKTKRLWVAEFFFPQSSKKKAMMKRIGVVYSKSILGSDLLNVANAAEVIPLEKELLKQGVEVVRIVWDPLEEMDAQKQVAEWSELQLEHVLVRYVWFYHLHNASFLRFLEIASKQCKWQLYNHEALIQWNCDKKYLIELHNKDERITIPPTVILKQHEFQMQHQQSSSGTKQVLKAVLDSKGYTNWDHVVLKPTISACGDFTVQTKLSGECKDDADSVEQTLDAIWSVKGRDVLVQPFLTSFSAGGNGEMNLVFFNGIFSHAYSKIALVSEAKEAAVVFPITSANMARTPTQPTDAEIVWAERIVQTAASLTGHMPLVARIDMTLDNEGQLVLTEFEAIEPCLNLDSSSLAKFVQAILSRVQQ